MLSEYDRLESDRDGVGRFHVENDEIKALERKRARCSMSYSSSHFGKKKKKSSRDFLRTCTC